MALQTRHLFIAHRIDELLGIRNQAVTEELLKQKPVLDEVNHFFSKKGLARIFIYFLPPEEARARGTCVSRPFSRSDMAGGLFKPAAAAPDRRNSTLNNKELDEELEGSTAAAGSGARQRRTSRDKPPGRRRPSHMLSPLGRFDDSDLEHLGCLVVHKDDSPPEKDTFIFLRKSVGQELDPGRASDGLLSFGLVNSPLRTLDAVLRHLYGPLVKEQNNAEWGRTSVERKKEFMVGIDVLSHNLQEALKTLSAGLQLARPDPRYEAMGAGAVMEDPGIMTELVDLFEEWCAKIEAYLDDTDRARWETNDSGPDTELEYWRRRMQRLTSITEQLKTKPCQFVVTCLSTVARQPPDGLMDRERMVSLLNRWKKIDLGITEALTEAKDNMKYLSTLERFMEPLYSGQPTQILDCLPSLMNAVKMIHTISRHYNTTTRMTKLFMKITNQMINTCKVAINANDASERIWKQEPAKLLSTLELCLRLNEQYQEQYRQVKEKLVTMPKGKQFDFSETQIFGKFDLFCRRVIKLIDLFSTVEQFRLIGRSNFEGVEALIQRFNSIIELLRIKGHDLLDYHNNKFDRDYVDFNASMERLEADLQQYINTSFDRSTSIRDSLVLLKKFQEVLHRENLRVNLESKFALIFHSYGEELEHVQETYERHRHNPPVARNMPPVAGNILWTRNLLQRIEEPMKTFQAYPSLTSLRDARKIIKLYNKIAKTLVAFEILWYEAWVKSIEAARAGLQATLIIRHPQTQRVYVNLDHEILQLIAEAKYLARMKVEVPEHARMVLLQEDKYKAYYDELTHTLREYDRVTSKVYKVVSKLIQPAIKTLDLALRPGMLTLTWTSVNIDAFRASVHASIQRVDDLISKINDIVDNRIAKNLKLISTMVLVDFPQHHAVSLDDFVVMQERAVRQSTATLIAKNMEVESAVEDLIQLARAHPVDPSVPPCPVEEEQLLRKHFRSLTQVALLRCNQLSFNTMQKRICARLVNGVFVIDRPFFDLDVQLAVPAVRISPSLDDVQGAINRAAVAVLDCSKKVRDWGQALVPERLKKTFFDILGKDLGIIKVCLRLTGALFTTRKYVSQYLSSFQRYDWLWRDDKEAEYRKFLARHGDNPDIDAFEAELIKYRETEADIDHIPHNYVIGALSLNTNNLKLQLKAEARAWQFQYASKLHSMAKERMSALFEYIRVTTNKLNREVNSLDSLRYVMVVLKEIRERETTIEIEIAPILDMYRLLEAYVPGTLVDKEEMDQKSIIRNTWRKLVEFAETITDNLSLVQGVYKKKLLTDTREFRADVKQFRQDFDEDGPMQQGIDPMEAVERLRRFKEDLAVRERKMEMYKAGEELFALQQSQYPELIKTRKEVQLLDQLYSLYVEVINSYETYKKFAWGEVLEHLKEMQAAADSFDNRCKRLPKKLKEWEAYLVLRKTITDLQDFLPLFEQLSKPSIKPRHWQEVIAITGTAFPYDKDSFRVENLIASPILQHKELVEEVCEGADKQLEIETKFLQIIEQWSVARFDFTVWKGRDIPILRAFGFVIEQLDESQLALQSLLSMRHVTPFKDKVQAKLTELSDTADTLELWVKVQLLWTSLESVFMGGDIAKQMPQDAKKFTKIDKDWAKIMARSLETGLVVPCCANELLRNTLPVLYSELEKCQKSLEGYLEQKRTKFPRFYFVSNPVLLLILSQGSDPMQMQPYYEKVFDSINRVVHDRNDKTRIVQIKSIEGSDEETISLVQDVVASNTNIEEWLGLLEKMMQRSLKSLCERAAYQCSHLPLRDFVDSNCGQFALLGIQFNWTAQCQEALDKCRANKHVMADTLKQQNNVLAELSSWCLTDLGPRMNRVKIETLITIHVHQRDVFTDILRLYKERKIQDPGDFEWLKQARFYWSPNKSDLHGLGACVVSICDIDFKYCFEYLGCKERLVITPLTDRCYITLSQALGMYLGGAPAGPAGTGKTETVKDLGRALGIFVVVTNCTDQQRYTDLAKIFKGLCQGGLWGCFDEFNRIELPVLSVVAQQVLAITNAKRTAASTFAFPGDSQLISLNPNVGYFITMNPGYQGRQELPENLKVLFRSVSMMVPDREIIMKVKLCSVGYQGFGELARKFNVLYRLCEQQLSKQKHYDFGLRNILSVLRTAGKTKRDNSRAPEEALLMRTLRDMNLSKLVAQDVPLFLSLLSDLFPVAGGAPIANNTNAEVERALDASLQKAKLVSHRSWNIKIIQLYETTLVRHGVMVVGPAGAGKSMIIQTLQDSLTTVTGVPYKRIRMNPKAIRAEEMFGETDKLSGEWLDGVFAAMWAKYNDRSRKDIQWIICDGPIDAIWIENLNTVLDDNKILTLANGDRIPMTDNVKLMFEVEDLRNASPATVSRAGIIFVSSTDLDWSPVMEAWLMARPDANQAAVLRSLVSRFLGRCDGNKDVGHLFTFLAKRCSLVVRTARVHLIESLIRLLTGLLTGASLSDNSPSDLADELERLFLFALTWAVGGLLESDDRLQLDAYLRSLGTPRLLPPGETLQTTLYDYNFSLETLDWERWTPPHWDYPRHTPEPNYASLLVPTADTTRSLFLLSNLVHKQRKPVLMAGGSGTAKTSTALMFFDAVLSYDKMLLKKVNFSSATTAGMFQRTVEGELDKRGGKNFGPPGGRKMTLFLDDLNMPEVNMWGDQPTLEVIRQLMEQGNVAFLDKDKRGDLKVIEDLQYVGAMSQPGAGKNDIPNRLKRHFFMFNLILPTVQSINDIYGKILDGRFPPAEHSGPFLAVARALPDATIRLWNWTRVKMLPSPSKFHYIFNLRELSRVFQGIVHTPKDSLPNELMLVKLWRHECERVFADKLTTLADKKALNAQLITQASLLLQPVLDGIKASAPRGTSAAEVQAAVADVVGRATAEAFFVDFLRDDVYDEDGVLVTLAPKIYEQGGSMAELRERVQVFLDQHNEEKPAQRMSLVLFDDAMRHLMRITRCLGMPRGNMLLVGVGGSGKQSLTRLASYIAGNETFQITLTKSYNFNSLMDDVRLLYKCCGQEGRSMTFVFTEAEVKDENFLEVLNSILMTGEVTNLFPKDELQVMAAELRTFALKENPHFHDTPENLVRCFIDRVRANLHIILCMSPVSAKFPERARKFPGLINGCTIDWYLPWPAEALVAVSEGFIRNVEMINTPETRQQLIVHMGMVHRLVVDSCDEYFQKMRRNVYQTPRSYLSFLRDYQIMYEAKVAEIDRKASSVVIGLDKLRKGAEDVEAMKVVLAEEEVKLRKAEEASNVMLKKLEFSSMEAKKEADAVVRIKEVCEADARRIEGEKKNAEEDLAKAQPFVDEAEHAVNSIKPPDLNELKQLKKPSDIIKLIFDCVGILKMEKLVKVEVAEVTLGIGKDKATFPFIKDSFKGLQTGMLSDARFLQSIFYFSKYEKDLINEETVELLLPYLELEGFTAVVARNASKAAEGLCTWCRAMVSYHEASKIVKPKLEALKMAQARLDVAQMELYKAEQKLQACQDVMARLQADFEAQMAQKRAIEENALNTKKRMQKATALIDGLAGERRRWTSDSMKFADIKRRLIGDVALACAFISYCGPFNQAFRDYLVREKLTKDLRERNVPVTEGINLTNFLVDVGTVGDWSLEGLPTDPLSIQNGILVTRSSRYPLLIDPQGQALSWIKNHEATRLPAFGVTTFGNPRFRDQLEFALQEGKALIVSGIEQELDPLISPVLEKQVVSKGKSKYVNIASKMCEYNDSFKMYLTTRLPNPHFSPEDQAKTTMVDFTVTQKGLEEQLLGRVIQKEQKSLEEQLKNVLAEVTNNTKALLRLDELLLERLSANTGNLLDDEELITVLAVTKAKSTEVNEKLLASGEMRKNIDEKREQYRPVATRGSLLYFAIVDMSLVNVMYQTSLDQFQTLFDRSMDVAERANLPSKRVNNIVEAMTYLTYRYINRGLYERDKVSFKLIVLLKILLTSGRLASDDVTLFLKGAAALDINSVRQKPFRWLSDNAWLNVIQLSSNQIFKNIVEDVTRNEAPWKAWYSDNEPEALAIPVYEPILAADRNGTGPFLRLLLVRMLREDRTLIAVNEFIRAMDLVDTGGMKLAAMGPRYVEPVADTVDRLSQEISALSPVIFLLSAGADPTESVETLARKKKTEIMSVSMGEGQERVASAAIATATISGSWVLLQNCHLGLAFMESMEELFGKIREACSPHFRLFITTEPHPRFPIGLLQMSTKVTNEPPKGLRAGLLRSYSVMIDRDKLERIETVQWRKLLYTLCFLHSIVQERRKFGPLGWCVPYEYNDGDLNACTTFLEKHIYNGQLSWPTLQYMVGEVQYGGKITDDLDRRMFNTYTESWLCPTSLQAAFMLNPEKPVSKSTNDFKYVIPDYLELEEYHAYIKLFPDVDSPELFGLHPNADLTFRYKEVSQLLNTILETQPKQSSADASGRTREDLVQEKCGELLAGMPEDYKEDAYLEQISGMGGLEVPLNIFLMQEVQRMQAVIEKVRATLEILLQAIRGEVVVTPEVMAAINSIYDARVPRGWLLSPGGDEISWMVNSLGLWFSGLNSRDAQFKTWLRVGRPLSYWLTGFFNPQGFLTAVQQEVTRLHKNDEWSLDSVQVTTEVTEFVNPENVKAAPKEGVFLHGLFLDGAGWDRPDRSLRESEPKKLFTPLPVMHVTAGMKAKARAADYGPYGGYECPVYKYPARTDRYLIFSVTLASRDKKPAHWTLRGVALLCTTD